MIEIAAIYLANMVATVRQSHLMYALPLQFIEVARYGFMDFVPKLIFMEIQTWNADVSTWIYAKRYQIDWNALSPRQIFRAAFFGPVHNQKHSTHTHSRTYFFSHDGYTDKASK